ncbi:ChaN family lipoprotein [Pararhodobacter sp. CCB-MM2]|uniref:ChaN family lipoprotein n=1 Tax=Pararhodobacter sp. CCB-MM2 TaxID=1786003 RepID=UPI000830DF6B|nr:ChaN family lipoprotein [Pararhodobacter sp. CCB-MM2]
MRAAILAVFAATPLWAQPIPVTDLDTLPPADVIFLGEVHDNPAHHLNQARAITALRPAAVVWEMLTPEQAAQMPDDRSDPAAVGDALGWADSGWPEFALYYPIVEAAGTARHYGAAVPRPEAQRAFHEGAAAVFGAEADRFGLNRPLPEDERETREAVQFAAHCEAMPLEMMGGMVEAQRLRDAALARAALQALEDTGGPVAVIAGSGHTRTDWGAPAALRIAAPEVVSLALGQSEGERSTPWDLWVVTAPVEREDPCTAFR